ARQRIQIQRQRRDERLAFARGHLRDAAEVQLDTAHELDVVRDHVPRELVRGHRHLAAEETPRGSAHRGERLGKNLVERCHDQRAQLTFSAPATVRAAELLIDALAFGGIRGRALRLPKLGDARLELAGALDDQAAEFRRLAPELVVGDVLKLLVPFVDQVDDRLNATSLPFMTGSHDRANDPFEHLASNDITRRARYTLQRY